MDKEYKFQVKKCYIRYFKLNKIERQGTGIFETD